MGNTKGLKIVSVLRKHCNATFPEKDFFLVPKSKHEFETLLKIKEENY